MTKVIDDSGPIRHDYKIRGRKLINEENRIREKFFGKFEGELGVINTLVSEILGPKLDMAEDAQGVGEFAYLFCSQSYSLLSNALDLLSRGYELESMMLLRPVAERAILTLYFCEFPDDLPLYLKDQRKFYSHVKNKNGKSDKSYIEAVLERMGKEGQIFSAPRHALWTEELGRSLIDEPSNVLHSSNINAATVASVRGMHIIRGPYYRMRSSRVVLSKIKQASFWSIMSLLTACGLPTAYWEELVFAHVADDLYGTKNVQRLNDLWSD